ncbi:fimbrial protein [Atlantibacter hermannii]|uniref:fimbrial protein n=1 Tax=Atlantibacter hermannii TaxID=565 RepID=UPI0011CD9779|nr:fimbrial protein [Atlantibacter hermannii]MDU1951152.1 fimbrial protein [Atlantibacter hermannii]MDW4574699.1 fimbrial protein [Atlantibacter hermannii]
MDMKGIKLAVYAAAFISGAVTPAWAAENAAGKIHFTGQIITPSCEIKGDTGHDSTVPLGTYPTTLFTKTGDESPLIPFSIKLTGCPATSEGLSAVQLTFNGTTALTGSTTLLDVSSISTLPGTTAATGVGVAVSPIDDSETYIAFDGSEDQVWVRLAIESTTDISADFNARYKSFSNTVTAGPADADLTVNILYR